MAYTTINKSTDYFNTKLYTGNGATQSITGVGFQPDWVWIKNRSTAHDHILTDAVRGVTKDIRSNNTDAEATDAQGLTAFGTDGFTVGTKANINTNGSNIVSWNWLASNSTASNTDGSITSTVSANTTAGFSIVTYTGTGSDANVGHSLSSAPELIITKSRSATGDWKVHTSAIDGSWDVGTLNSTAALTNSSYTAPTSSIFYVGTGAPTNASGVTYVSYLFHSVKGYSKFGSFTGNGNADGTFIYTGFRPAFILVRASNLVTNWHLYDNKRDPINPADIILRANASNAEATSSEFAYDFVSNGFKARSSGSEFNGSGNTFIYMAFGQSIVGSNNVPCTAR
jgi:hypothetical protein